MAQDNLFSFQPNNVNDAQQGLLSAFNPSDALPAPRYTGMLLPIERDMYGTKGNFELAVPQFLQDAYSGINKFGQAFRGELSPQELQQLAFDTSMNVTGGSLLGSRVIPNAVPKGGVLSMGVSKTPNQTGLLGKVDNVQPKSGVSEVVPPTDKSDGIFVFHGSGADFDEFKLSKIGTGEGAQVFGHGLYFTDSKDIAKFYKDAMLKSQNVEFNGKPISFLSDNQDIDNKTVVLGKIRDRILGGKYNSKEAIDNVKYEYEQTINNNFDLSRPLNAIDKQNYNDLKSDLDFINTLDAKNFNYRAGKTYEVKLNTITDNLINHDIPINQQSKSMQSKVKDIMKIMPFAQNAFFKLDNNLSGGLFRQELTSQVESAINNIATNNVMVLKGQMSKTAFNKMLDNEPFIKIVNEKIKNPKNITGYIGNPLASSPKIASEIMNDFGIKGIKYKAGQLTSGQKDSKATNYVIFDDKIIDIMKKYGIVGAVGVTAMQGGEQSSEANLSL